MDNLSNRHLGQLLEPRSIALAGITVANPEHWTRTFLNSLLEFKFEGQIYLVNPRGGEIKGLKVYRKLEDVPDSIDYVISTVSAQVAPGLIEECAAKGVKAIQFCTAGFSETGEEEGIRLEAEMAKLARQKGIRLLGPNCMGVYCPQSRLSFQTFFPKENGKVGIISQSGGNATTIVDKLRWRGVQFSKVISYGNACDIDESDLLEYLTTDASTEIIALYIEGVKGGKRFREALGKAARKKAVVLLKGGVTAGGARAAAGHTGALAGREVTWDALCKQTGVIRVNSLEELCDTVVTLLFMSPMRGRRVALIGGGGGASVLITDEFEGRGIKVPPLTQEIKERIREFSQLAGNILRNPVDYSQNMVDTEKIVRTTHILARWQEVDFLIGFIDLRWATPTLVKRLSEMIDGLLAESRAVSKPMAWVVETSVFPENAGQIFSFIQKCVSSGMAVYYSFADAANALNLVLNHTERHLGRLEA